MNHRERKRILVVCLGNICRSPTGEAVLRAKAEAQGIHVEIDSAGTIAYHKGNPPDERARAAGEKRGYCFDGIRARRVCERDFKDFDMILAADYANLEDLQAMCPEQYQHKLSLFLSHGSCADEEIPDPYHGGPDGFERVLDLMEDAADTILRKI
jgi:protein-tyrosine phosphatase